MFRLRGDIAAKAGYDLETLEALDVPLENTDELGYAVALGDGLSALPRSGVFRAGSKPSCWRSRPTEHVAYERPRQRLISFVSVSVRIHDGHASPTTRPGRH